MYELRCKICNSILDPSEIHFNKFLEEWDPCSKCLIIIHETNNEFEEDPEYFLEEYLSTMETI